MLLFASMCLSILGAVSFPYSVARADEDSTHRVEIPVKALLTPAVGFEEKNNIEIVLYGALPNGCYSLAEYTVEKETSDTIRIRQYAVHETTGMCAEETTLPIQTQMVIPFVQEISVGRLPVGEYKFLFTQLNTGEQVRTMSVAKNVTPTVDSLPYAAVSNVQSPDVINGLDHVVATVTGVLNSTCSKLNDNVRVLRENDVYVLLPTIRVEKHVLCAQVLIPFEKKVDLGPAKQPGIYLIHTRSMNGKAVNKVINVMK